MIESSRQPYTHPTTCSRSRGDSSCRYRSTLALRAEGDASPRHPVSRGAPLTQLSGMSVATANRQRGRQAHRFRPACSSQVAPKADSDLLPDIRHSHGRSKLDRRATNVRCWARSHQPAAPLHHEAIRGGGLAPHWRPLATPPMSSAAPRRPPALLGIAVEPSARGSGGVPASEILRIASAVAAGWPRPSALKATERASRTGL